MIKGKGIYAWILRRCENGDMVKVIAKLKQAATGYVTMCRLMHDYMYFLEECFFKGIIEDIQKGRSE